jgi:hypothetical protein
MPRNPSNGPLAMISMRMSGGFGCQLASARTSSPFGDANRENNASGPKL